MQPPSYEEGTTRWAKFYISLSPILYDMLPYDIDFQSLREKIRSEGFERVLLQLPEGLKIYATEIVDALKGYNVYISTKPCYGACDIEVYPDMLTLHFGHSEIPNIKYPPNIVFVETFSKVSFKNVVEKFLEDHSCDSAGLVASVQHIPQINEVRELLESRGIETYVGNGDGRVKYPGQILGCNFSTAREVAKKVSCFLFLGTGDFHAMGVEMATGKKTYVIDPFAEKYHEVSEKVSRFMRQRFGAIVKAEEADKYGIIVSSKIGQRRIKLAMALKEMIESTGKKAYLLMSDVIIPEELYYDVDVYVNTACPRVTYDDYLRFPRPIISPVELEIALKFKLWENFKFDEIVEVD